MTAWGGSGWGLNEEFSSDPYFAPAAIEEIKANPSPLDLYYDIIGSSEAGAFININDYYTGNETVCGISCWVVDLGTYGGHSENYKFWLNPANGHTLKMEEGEGNAREVWEVLKYDPDFKVWPDGLKP